MDFTQLSTDEALMPILAPASSLAGIHQVSIELRVMGLARDLVDRLDALVEQARKEEWERSREVAKLTRCSVKARADGYTGTVM